MRSASGGSPIRRASFRAGSGTASSGSTSGARSASEVLFYQWLEQQSFGQLIEVTAEFVIPEKADVNIGLAITKFGRSRRQDDHVIGEIAVGRTFKDETRDARSRTEGQGREVGARARRPGGSGVGAAVAG